MLDGAFSDSVKKNFTSQDFRFTAKGDHLYAIAMAPSQTGDYTIQSLRAQERVAGAVFHGVISQVEVLGCQDAPQWTRDEKGLHIHTGFSSEKPLVFKITLD